jgi:hypothetical protein
MDETKNPSGTEGSPSPAEAANGSSDETRDLSVTKGSQPLLESAGASTIGDPSKIGRYRIIHRLVPRPR